MKSFIFFLGIGFAIKANAVIEVPFTDQNQTVLIQVGKSRCQEKGPMAYTLQMVALSEQYKMVCQLRPPVDQYDSSTSIQLISDFHYPNTILEKPEFNSFEDLKKQGAKAIRQKKHVWGKEYWWATPTEGTTFTTYLCPKKSKHCFEIVHGGIERLSFKVRQEKTKNRKR